MQSAMIIIDDELRSAVVDRFELRDSRRGRQSISEAQWNTVSGRPEQRLDRRWVSQRAAVVPEEGRKVF